MKHFRKVWTDGMRAWMLERKDMNRNAAYALFLREFPEASDVTATAFFNERSRIGAVTVHYRHSSTKARPLYAEQVKKGYVRIKVAQPNVWKTKSRWVYEETHPWEDFTERSNYIFLDGDSRNFDPANIERVPLRLMGLFAMAGGCVPGRPDLTRAHVLQARLKYARFDLGERTGLVVDGGGGRVFREERNRRMREYNSTPERRRIVRERARRYRERIRREEPEKFEAQAERHKEYVRGWYQRRRAR